MKSILLHMNDDEAQGSRMEAALATARVMDAHLTCCHSISLSSLVVNTYPLGVWTGYPTDALRKEAEEAWQRFRDKWEAKLAKEDVPWTWARLHIDSAHGLQRKALLADLTIVSLTDRDMGIQSSKRFLGEIVTGIRGPVLGIPEDLKRFEPKGQVLVAWDGSEEAARALRSSIPFLKQADNVLVVRVGKGKVGHEGLESAARYLGYHGLEVEIDELVEKETDSYTILDAAKGVAADLIVMGAYGRPRMAEMMLGGVTQHMLTQREFPVLFTH
ncbi:universal stress protein [Pacificimonas sp. WHA3]|uniref:Universal stress protein n=1 Tax=Pacificimonas pallii TaxID=2827236 RepID=A0ABS6SE36_9SPHN|nr:universal stress protein [Pacificimonas pallii]MBV7256611.1 universal stress protein [Pacificimonas pallii]